LNTSISAPVRLAVLVNTYPAVTHTFIRREIRALEELGVHIERFSLRRTPEPLPDSRDVEERQRTEVILGQPTRVLFGCLLRRLFISPIRFLRTLVTAVRLGTGSTRGVLLHFVYLMEAAYLGCAMQRRALNHVHAHFGTNSAMVALLCGSLTGRTFSFTVHGPEEFDQPRALRLPDKIRSASFVCGISDFTRSQLFRWCRPEDRHKISVVRCGLAPEELLGSGRNSKNHDEFVTVSRLTPEKGHLTLLEAAHRLSEEGFEFRIRVIGDGPLRRVLAERIRQLHLDGCIELCGWQTGAQVAEAIRSARTLVVSSYAEGLPVVIMESYAAGTPVISTWVSGIPELVHTGLSGWLVPPGSAEALCGAMREALQATDSAMESMAEQGRARLRTRHDASREAGKLLALCNASLATSSLSD